jgi:hypothetical protein
MHPRPRFINYSKLHGEVRRRDLWSFESLLLVSHELRSHLLGMISTFARCDEIKAANCLFSGITIFEYLSSNSPILHNVSRIRSTATL